MALSTMRSIAAVIALNAGSYPLTSAVNLRAAEDKDIKEKVLDLESIFELGHLRDFAEELEKFEKKAKEDGSTAEAKADIEARAKDSVKTLTDELHELQLLDVHELQDKAHDLKEKREDEEEAYLATADPIKEDIKNATDALQKFEEINGDEDREGKVSTRLNWTKDEEGAAFRKTVAGLDDTAASKADRDAVLAYANQDVDFDDAIAQEKATEIVSKIKEALEKSLAPIEEKEAAADAAFHAAHDPLDEQVRENASKIEATKTRVGRFEKEMNEKDLEEFRAENRHAEHAAKLSASEQAKHDKNARRKAAKKAAKEAKAAAQK